MNILVIGAGGREHSLIWKMKQSPKVKKIYCAPGNAGTAELAENIPIKSNDLQGLLDFATHNEIELTIVGPEEPLVLGIVDLFNAHDLTIFGPDRKAAQVEGSKDFSKRIMQKANIPTAKFATFTDLLKAKEYVLRQGAPIVIKADGLAAGKGVTVAHTTSSALEALDLIMNKKEFGSAGEKVVIEECLIGQEISILAVTDGISIRALAPAQDHKAVFDGDQGPNTGGMGAYSPAPLATPQLMRQIQSQILDPMLLALSAQDITYRGVLYAGLIITQDGPKVIEFNCRFGDPECQVIMPRLKTDLIDILLACIDGELDELPIKWLDQAVVTVVLTSKGYPGKYPKGIEITGLGNGNLIFHAGTTIKDNKIVTAGGRVLNVIGMGNNIQEAITACYQSVSMVGFEGMHYRKDIGQKAVAYKE